MKTLLICIVFFATFRISVIFSRSRKRIHTEIATLTGTYKCSSVQDMFCSLQTQDLPHITFSLQEHKRSCRKSEVIIPSKNTDSGPAASFRYLQVVRRQTQWFCDIGRQPQFGLQRSPQYMLIKGWFTWWQSNQMCIFTHCKLYFEIIQVLVTRNKFLLQVIPACDKFPGCI